MSAAQIFRGYVRFIGVGAIATAGIFGIVKSLRIVAGSFSIALRRCGPARSLPAVLPRHASEGGRTRSSAPTATSRSCRS